MTRVAAPFLCLALAAPALGEPAAPVLSPIVAALEVGLFCTPTEMGETPAPGTATGKMHVPFEEITFDWPDRRVVPAELGLAFGIRAQLAPGNSIPFGEVRVWAPNNDQPDYWGMSFSDLGATLAFFSFDRPSELVPGIWRFEGWDGTERLFLVEFEVVPAENLPGIAGACGAVS